MINFSKRKIKGPPFYRGLAQKLQRAAVLPWIGTETYSFQIKYDSRVTFKNWYFWHYCYFIACLIRLTVKAIGETKQEVGRPAISRRMVYFICMLLSSTLYGLSECQGTPCSKQAPYLKFKLQQRDSNPQPLSS